MSTYAGLVQDDIDDLRGNALTRAVVKVYNADTTVLATLYDNPVLIASATSGDLLVNDPVTGLPAADGLMEPGFDEGANYTFYADSDFEYDVVAIFHNRTFGPWRVRPVQVVDVEGVTQAELLQETSARIALGNSLDARLDTIEAALPGLEDPLLLGPTVYLSTLTPANGRNVDDVLTVNGSNIITSVKANWTSADVGKPITVGNGETGVAVRTTITAFDNEGQVRTAANMAFTTIGDPVGASWGTDCGPALQAALASFAVAGATTTRLVVDGMFYQRTPVAQGFNQAAWLVELVGLGYGSAIIMDGGPSATMLWIYNAVTILVKDITFVGTKWVAKDANICLQLSSSISQAKVDHCNFFGLSAGNGAMLRFTNCVGIVDHCSLGGCGIGTGSTIHFYDWMGARVRDTMSIDFAYAFGNVYSTTNTTGSPGVPGNTWILVDQPQNDPKTNASSQGMVELRNLLLDEAPTRTIIVRGGAKRIQDVDIENVQVNGSYVDSANLGTEMAVGVVIENTDRVRIRKLWTGYRGSGQSPSDAAMVELIDAGVVELIDVRRGDAPVGIGGGASTMNKITADADTVSLTLTDCLYTTLEADCPVVIKTAAVGGVVAANKLSGVVTDADFDADPPDGTLKVTGNRIAIRNAGQWIYLSAPAVEPSAPAAPVADPQNASVGLTWVEPANGNAIITGYVITPYIAGVAQSTTTVGNVQTGIVTGLVNGTTYTFKVAAINEVGTGAQSPASNAAIPVVRPSDISGLAMWFRADALGLADGASVDSWTDSSGLGRHAVPGIIPAPPTLQTNELNGKPVVRFDGVDDVLRTPTFTLPQPITTFVVAKWATTTNYKAILDGYAASTGSIDLEAGAIRLYAGAAGSFGAASTAWRLLAITWSGASSVGRAEGGAGTVLNTGASAQAGLTIGSGGLGGGGFAACDIAEVAVFSRVLTTSELNQMGSYLAAKYGLTWNTVP